MRAIPRSPVLASVLMVLAFVGAFSACRRTGEGEPVATPSDRPRPPADPEAPVAHTGKVPDSHRERATACSTDKTKGDVETRDGKSATDAPAEDARAECTRDADCTKGKNGRCAMTGGGRMRPHPGCVYDQCFVDADCGPRSECVCGGRPGAGNYCRGGNCATDADCGSGYCSPSYGLSCGSYGGYQGNYCHGPDDECTNDSECAGHGAEPGGYCAWNPASKRWKCGYAHCVG